MICGTGYRSLVAIGELASQGIDGLINMPGGMPTGKKRGCRRRTDRYNGLTGNVIGIGPGTPEVISITMPVFTPSRR